MRKSAAVPLSLAVVLVILSSWLNAQSLTPSPTGNWTVTGAMAVARSGAAAAALANGSVLVTGGTDGSGNVLATAELYGSNGAFTPAAPMIVARSGHTAIWLASNANSAGGYVLVTGGTSTGGAVLNSAELYDPTVGSAGSWTLLQSSMLDAVSGEPASPLANSSVLLSGGANSSGVPLMDLQQFSLASQQFSLVDTLLTARMNHVAAALQDGRVFIAGGTDGSGNTLKTTEIYDSVAGTVTAGPALNTPRANATATTLLDGTVLIAGGSYPEGVTVTNPDGSTSQSGPAELNSAEIFDPVANTITPVTATLVQARAGQLAFLLPNNNAVLLVGGTYNGATLQSAELYTPWDQTFTATATTPQLPRSSATGAALFPLADGQLLVAGGSNVNPPQTTTVANSAELYGFATVETNQSDYSPGTPVVVTGTGWQPSETVALTTTTTQSGADTPPVKTTVANPDGTIGDSFWAPDNTDIGARFYLKATGQTSGSVAQNTFTDSTSTTVTITGNGTVADNQGPTINCTETNGTPSGTCSHTYASFTSVTLTATAASGYAFSSWSTSGSPTCTPSSNTCAFQASFSSGSNTVTATFVSASLAFTTSAISTPAGSTCAGPVTVQAQTTGGVALNVLSTETVTLAAVTNVTYYPTNACGTSETSFTIASGASSGSFYFKDTTAGNPLFSVTGSGAFTTSSAATQTETVYGTASKLVVTGTGTQTAGGSQTVTITAEDSNGNTVLSFSGSKNLTFSGASSSSNPATAPTVKNSSGTAVAFGNTTAMTFTNGAASGAMVLYDAQTATIVADDTTDSILSSGAGNLSVVVSATTASKLVVTGTGTQTAGGSQTVTVTAEDAYGNTATGTTGSKNVTFSGASSSPNPATAPTVKNSSGTAVAFGSTTAMTFTTGAASGAMVLYDAQTATIAATDTTDSISSSGSGNLSVVVSATTANKLAFTTQPGGGTGGTAWGTQPVVTVEDQYGNTVSNTDSIQLAITTNPSSGTLACTTNPLAASAGVATFGGCNINKSGNGYILTASFSGLTAAVSNSFNITVGTASQLVITGSATQTAGVAQNLTITAEDAGGNTATTYTASHNLTFSGAASSPNPVTAPTVKNSSGTVTAFGTATAITFTNGVATVASGNNGVMTLYDAQTASINATDGTINSNSGGSLAVTVSATTANKLVFSTQPGGGVNPGVPLSPQPLVEVEDTYGNPILTTPPAVTLAITGGSGNSAGTLTCTTNPVTPSVTTGIATFAGCSVSASSGGTNYTLTATTGAPSSLTSAASSSFAINGPTKLVFTTQPGAGALTAGVCNAFTVTSEINNGTSTTPSTTLTVNLTSGSATGKFYSNNTCTSATETTVSLATSASSFWYEDTQATAAPYTVTGATSTLPGITTATSNSYTVNAGPATKLAYTTVPATGTAGTAFSVTVQSQDANGNPASPTSTTTITLSKATGGGTLSGTLTGTILTSGTGVTISTPVYSKSDTMTLTASASPSLTQVTSGNIVFSAGTATQLVFTTPPSTTGTSDVAWSAQPVVAVEDSAGNTVTTYATAVSLAINSGSGTLTCGAATPSSGVATFSGCYLDKATTYTLKATSGTIANSTTNPSITISAGTATQLVFTTPPSTTGTSNVAWSAQPVVTVEDSAGNTVTSYATAVSLAINSGSGTLTCGAATPSSGVATFSGCYLDKATTYTLKATSGTIVNSTTNPSIAISAGTATQLVFTTPPSTTGTSDVAWSAQPVVTVEDSAGNTVTTYATPVSLAINSGSGTLTCGAATPSLGVATFSGCYLDKATTYTLKATTTGIANSTTNPSITISAGTATQLVFTTPPSTTGTSNVAWSAQPVVTVEDSAGNTVTTYATAVSLAINSGSGTLTCGAATPSLGVATFSGCYLDKATTYTLKATTTGIANSTTNPSITISAGTATQLVFTTPPSTTGTSNVAWSAQPVVTVEDSAGNTVTTYATAVSLAINSGSGTLTCSAATPSSGVATFSGCYLDKATSYTLKATSGTIVNSTTNPSITISAGTATQLVFTTPPSTTGTSNVAWSAQPVVTVEDSAGNTVTSYATAVSLAINSGSGTLTCGAATPSSGVATFSGCYLDKATTYTLKATSGTIVNSTTNPSIAISAGTATQLVFTTPPSTTGTSDVAWSAQPVVTVEDSAGNTVTTYATPVSLAINSGSGTLTCGAATPSLGVATFSGCYLDKATTYTLKATTTGIANSTTNPSITISAGTATQLVFTTPPSTTGTSNVAWSAQPVVTVEDSAGNTVTTYATAVSLAINSGSGTLTCGAATPSLGVATFSGCYLDKATTYTLKATSGTIVNSTTNPSIAISAGTATQLVFTTPPSTTGTSDVAWSAQPAVTVEDSAGNTVTSYATAVSLAINSGSGTLTCGAATPSSGVATFSGCYLDKATAYTLKATTTGIANSTTNPSIAISAGTASQLVFTTPPSTTGTSNVAWSAQPVVTVEDSAGNTVTTYATPVSLAINSGSGTLTCGAATPSSGVATFSGCYLDKATAYTLKATSGTIVNSTTNPSIAISAGTATQLVFTTPPSTTGTSDVAWSAQPVVTVEDSAGNTVTSYATAVSLAINSGSGTLTCSAATPSSGVATFSGCYLDKATAYTLKATTTGIANSTTNPSITISAGTATQLSIETAADGSGTPLATQNVTSGNSVPGYAIERDSANNFVANPLATWSLTGVTGGVLQTDLSPSSGTGTTFTGHKTGSATMHASVSSPSLSATSNVLTVVAGPVYSNGSTVSANPTSVVANGTSSSTITVTLLDASGNPVSGKTVTLAGNSGTSSSITGGGASNSSGVVTFTVTDTISEVVTYTATDGSDQTTITQTAGVTFTPSTYQLNVSSNNTAYGTVTVPATSGTYYPVGSVVPLTAVATAGNYFTGWTGSADIASASSASTTITMNGTELVTANFAPIPGYVVTTATDDSPTGTAANCPGADCSLRDALAAASAAGAGNITFDPTVFASAQTINLGSGLTVPATTTITGPTTGSGATLTNLVTVSGGGVSNQFSVFTVNSGVTGAAINNLIITNGYVSGNNGGGINNSGTLTLTGSTISGNSAPYIGRAGGQTGGGIFNNGGTLTVSGSTISGNNGGIGGGIYNFRGTLTATGSTISGNNASQNGGGGGIYNDDSGTLTVTGSTISGNSATGGRSSGGGIENYSGTLTLSNCIVAGNTAGTNADIDGGYTDNGGNQVNQASSAISLAPLGNYGGPTQTMPPLPASAAICGGLAANVLGTTDQRGDPNTNTTYTGFSSGTPCVDSGAVQTDYSLSFSAEPPSSTPPDTNFAAAVTLDESGTAFTGGSVSIPLSLTGNGALSNGSASTANGVASYSALQVSATGTGDTLTAGLTLTAPSATPAATISAASSPFDVTSSATTVAASGATATYSASAQSVTLSATVSSMTAVNSGTVTFTLLQGGTTIGSPATSGTVTSGAASTSYTLPAGTPAASYTIQAVYNPGAGFTGNSDSSQSLVIGQATPTIGISNLPASGVYGGGFTATYSYSGNGSPTESVASTTPSVCTVSGNAVSYVGVGLCTLQASATATTDYTAVTGSTQSFTVGQATPGIGISNLPGSGVYGGGFTATYSYSGNGSPTESVASTTPSVCTVSGNAVSYVGVGLCTLQASATATTDYTAVTGSTQSFTVGQATPGIGISNLPASGVYGGGFTATYSYSGNGSPTESVASTTPSVCTVSGNAVSYVGVGLCTLQASATATTDYTAVTGSTQSFTVGQATSTTVVTSLNSSIYADQTTMLTATVTGIGVPTGSVTFFNGTTQLGSPVGLSTGAIATLSLSGSQLSLGANSITASYSGDGHYVGTISLPFTETLLSSQASFGSVPGGTAPLVQTLTYAFTSPTTLSAVDIVTIGATGLDYTDPDSSSACTVGVSYAVGQSCTITVTFTPSASGQRFGGVVLYAQGSTMPLQTWYLSGTSQSSLVTIDPGTQTTLATLGNGGQAYGSAIDGVGNLYVVDHANSAVIELAAGTFTPTTVVSSGLLNPTAVALDGAGNLYISDTGNSRVVVVPNEQGTLNTADLSVVPITGLASPRGIAVDGGGNLYVADATNGDVVEVPAGGGSQTTVASGLTAPRGVAVDASANVYVTSNNQVGEYPAGGGTLIPYGTGYSNPRGIAVDASGTVYVADSGNNRIVVVAPGGASQSDLAITGVTSPQGVTLDTSANVYVTVGGSVYEVNRTQAAALAFGSTAALSASTPQTVTVTNAGNQTLNVSSLVISTTNFTQVSSGGTDCSSSTTLGAAGQCLIAVEFTPQTGGATLTGTVTLTDNALNNLASTQTVPLSGASSLASQAITVTMAPPSSAAYNSTFPVAATAGSGDPVAITVSGGCSIPSGTTASGTVTMTSGITGCLVMFNQAGDGNYSAAPQVTEPPVSALLATQAALTVTNMPLTAQAYGAKFTVGSSGGSGTGTVTFAASGACSNSSGGALISIISATGICSVTATSPANSNYSSLTTSPAATVAATLASESITVTTAAPASAGDGSTFNVAATANSGLAVSIAGSGGCSGSGTINPVTITMTSSATACTVTFSQSGNGNYTAATSVLESTTATKGTPSVNSWPTASSITVGLTLASSTLSGGSASVQGTFAFTSPSTIPAVGTASQSVTFTPMDTTDYAGVVGSVSVTVKSAPSASSPTFNAAAGSYNTTQTVMMGNSFGAPMYYTLNGSTPTAASTPYTVPITVSTTGTTIKAIAVGNGYGPSTVASATYTLVALSPSFSVAAGSYITPQSVSLGTVSTGAPIYYTTNGTTPTASSTLYTMPITVSATGTTIKAIAVGNGYGASAVASATYTLVALAPTFNSAAGTYNTPQSVSLGTVSTGAPIYYTTNGTTPTASSTLYTMPITVSATGTTIKAIAVGNGYGASAVASATYTLVALAPTFNSAAGTYNTPQSVTLSTVSTGAPIYYTTDGTTPSTSSTPYTRPITVSASGTIRAIASGNGYGASAVASATYTIR